MSEDNHYIADLRSFIQNEFRAEIRDKSSVVIDCLVCKHNPSPSCLVCFPSQNAKSNAPAVDPIAAKTKRFSGYASATHFHSVGKNKSAVASGNRYVDLSGDPITDETLNQNKMQRQIRKMQELITDLRSNCQRLEMEKGETMDALKQVTFVCSNMRNRQRALDLQVSIVHCCWRAIILCIWVCSLLCCFVPYRDCSCSRWTRKCSSASTA